MLCHLTCLWGVGYDSIVEIKVNIIYDIIYYIIYDIYLDFNYDIIDL